MNFSQVDRSRLQRVLRDMRDQRALNDDCHWLKAVVAAHDEARELYIESLWLTASLQWLLKLDDAQPLLSGVNEPSVSKARPAVLGFLSKLTSPFQRPLVWSICGAGLLFAGYSAMLLWNLRDGELPTGTDGNLSAVAVLGDAAGVRWSNGSSPKANHADVAAGERLGIESGTIELQLKQGATLLIEGPADWSIDGANNATLTRGKVVARVPRSAIGFALQTPSARIVDLGTEFGVHVGEGGETEVHVLRGEVEAVGAVNGAIAQQQPIRVIAGEALRIEPNQAGQAVPINAKQFAKKPKAEAPPAPVGDGSQFIAYHSPQPQAGNHGFSGSVGLDFDVVRPIEVLRLGAFDSDGDGFAGDVKVTVELWQRNANATPDNPKDDTGVGLIATREFTWKTPGELEGNSRFLELDRPLRLFPGAYTIVARGYDKSNPYRNVNIIGAPLPESSACQTNDGGGLLRFVGLSRYGTGYPTTVDQRQTQYAAGTFAYREAPRATIRNAGAAETGDRQQQTPRQITRQDPELNSRKE